MKNWKRPKCGASSPPPLSIEASAKLDVHQLVSPKSDVGGSLGDGGWTKSVATWNSESTAPIKHLLNVPRSLRCSPICMGIFDIEVPGNWVLPDDQLWLAIVKPPYTGPNLIENDASRPEALALASALFSRNGEGQYPIAINAPLRNAVVLFPEFAFGSGDFANLDALIRPQPRPVMVFAGFGAIRGDRLRTVIQEEQILCGWQSGIEAVDATKRYNAAWCWIHDPRQNGANSHRCYILLKNWPEQRTERVGIPDLAGGTETVRLVADDCTIFPLICADILCNTANCPQERIAASIRASNLNRNKVLIPVLMLDGKPSNPAWSSRLAHMIQADPNKVAIITCNHVSVSPLSAELDDQMRCLSGALVSIQQFSPDHRELPHPSARKMGWRRGVCPSLNCSGYRRW